MFGGGVEVFSYRGGQIAQKWVAGMIRQMQIITLELLRGASMPKLLSLPFSFRVGFLERFTLNHLARTGGNKSLPEVTKNSGGNASILIKTGAI
ncbi:MAG: hypothetical protein M0Z52_07610 [Actinomycetota bacterium]|nr:hypothetical protein [Actinomycetota bacterium]